MVGPIVGPLVPGGFIAVGLCRMRNLVGEEAPLIDETFFPTSLLSIVVVVAFLTPAFSFDCPSIASWLVELGLLDGISLVIFYSDSALFFIMALLF